jgi:hypothetical protein
MDGNGWRRARELQDEIAVLQAENAVLRESGDYWRDRAHDLVRAYYVEETRAEAAEDAFEGALATAEARRQRIEQLERVVSAARNVMWADGDHYQRNPRAHMEHLREALALLAAQPPEGE